MPHKHIVTTRTTRWSLELWGGRLCEGLATDASCLGALLYGRCPAACTPLQLGNQPWWPRLCA